MLYNQAVKSEEIKNIKAIIQASFIDIRPDAMGLLLFSASPLNLSIFISPISLMRIAQMLFNEIERIKSTIFGSGISCKITAEKPRQVQIVNQNIDLGLIMSTMIKEFIFCKSRLLSETTWTIILIDQPNLIYQGFQVKFHSL